MVCLSPIDKQSLSNNAPLMITPRINGIYLLHNLPLLLLYIEVEEVVFDLGAKTPMQQYKISTTIIQ